MGLRGAEGKVTSMKAARSSSSTLRWADYVTLPEDELRELVAGRLVAGEQPTKWHEAMVAYLVHQFWNWCRKRGLHVLGSGYRVRITDRVGVQPALQVLTDATYRAAGSNGLEAGRPELVVEVLSPSSRAHDRVRKVHWYARLGVPEYWLFDGEARSVERLVLDGSTYRLAQQVSGDRVFRPGSMRGLAIGLEGLWALMD